jgi:O-acetyl-ADP-ribose deacetylase
VGAATSEGNIGVRVGGHGDVCDIALSDMKNLGELAAELESAMEDCRTGESVRIALLPPMPPGIAARSAFKRIVDTWLAATPSARRNLDCVVASERVADALTVLLPGRDQAETVFQVGHLRLVVTEGDITAVGADAIVNASNTSLRLGGGVSAAIRQACGPGLGPEMASIARRHPLGDGDAVVTGTYGLKTASYIIHVASAAGDPGTVRRSLQNVLRLCTERGFRTVAMPALGTGTGGMPMTQFSGLLATAWQQHAESGAQRPQLLRLILYSPTHAGTAAQVLSQALRRPA